MATPLDIKVIPKIRAIIEKYGVEAVFETYPLEHLDEVTGDIDHGAAVKFDMKVSPPSPWETNIVNNTLVIRSKLACIVPSQPTPFVPFIGQKVEIGGFDRTVMEVEALVSGDEVAAYVLGLE